MDDERKNWKLRLRYGKLKTEFLHYTVLADGVAGLLAEGFDCTPGRAFMGMKVWAVDDAQAADMIRVIGNEIGFTVDGRIHVYSTEPEQPPGDKPKGYDITFTSYSDEET